MIWRASRVASRGVATDNALLRVTKKVADNQVRIANFGGGPSRSFSSAAPNFKFARAPELGTADIRRGGFGTIERAVLPGDKATFILHRCNRGATLGRRRKSRDDFAVIAVLPTITQRDALGGRRAWLPFGMAIGRADGAVGDSRINRTVALRRRAWEGAFAMWVDAGAVFIFPA
jgi:hypothetical protein